MRTRIVATALGALILAGCAGGGGESGGTITGVPGGGVVGSDFAPEAASGAEVEIGALAGGLLGAEIGRSLDERDRHIALQAEYQALEFGRAGQPVEWSSGDGDPYGRVVVGPSYEVNRLDCREYTHHVYIGGRPRVVRGTACRQPDSRWRIVS